MFQPRCRYGRAEQIALHLTTPELSQDLALHFRLDTFGGRCHLASAGHVNDRLDDGRGIVGLAYVPDKTAIDLDLVKGETM